MKHIGGQLEMAGMPERTPQPIHVIIHGRVNHRHVFDANTPLAAVLEMAREQGAESITFDIEPPPTANQKAMEKFREGIRNRDRGWEEVLARLNQKDLL